MSPPFHRVPKVRKWRPLAECGIPSDLKQYMTQSTTFDQAAENPSHSPKASDWSALQSNTCVTTNDIGAAQLGQAYVPRENLRGYRRQRMLHDGFLCRQAYRSSCDCVDTQVTVRQTRTRRDAHCRQDTQFCVRGTRTP